MKLSIKQIIFSGLIMTVFFSSSCKKENITTENTLPAVPVTVANQYGYYGGTTVRTSLSGGGNVQVVLSIPQASGRTIKEITRVAAASGTASYSSVRVTTGLYNTAPIPGNGTAATFNTTLAEFTAKTGQQVPTMDQAGTTADVAVLNRNFYFLITLDNGETIVPNYVRVFVDK